MLTVRKHNTAKPGLLRFGIAQVDVRAPIQDETSFLRKHVAPTVPLEDFIRLNVPADEIACTCVRVDVRPMQSLPFYAWANREVGAL